MSELSGDLPDGHAIPARPADPAIVVRGYHFLDVRLGEAIHERTFVITKGVGLGLCLRAHFAPKWVRFYALYFHLTFRVRQSPTGIPITEMVHIVI